MLGKLLKYELKATSRLFLYMYIGLIVVAFINMATMPVSQMGETDGPMNGIMAIISSFLMVVYVIMVIAIIVVTVLYLVVRFYKNQLGDEGYLMFTLPVSVDKHILSKLIAAMLWSISSLVVLVISALILLAKLQLHSDIFGNVAEAWRALAAAGAHPALWILGLLGVYILSFLAGYNQYYAAMAIGPNLIKNRLGGSILAYVIIYVVYNVVSTILLLLWFLPFVTGLDGSAVSFQYEAVNLTALEGMTEGIQTFNTMGLYALGFCATLYVLTTVPCYLVTRFMLKKKLNLA
jgi:hypothetical protein